MATICLVLFLSWELHKALGEFAQNKGLRSDLCFVTGGYKHLRY